MTTSSILACRQRIALDGSVEASNPDVYNNVVVWQDRRNGNWDIYGYNLTTKTTFPIITNTADQTNPAITFSPWLGGYVVVWQDARDGDWDIYGAILNGPEVAGCASPLIGDVNVDSVTDANDIDEVEMRLGQQNGIPPEAGLTRGQTELDTHRWLRCDSGRSSLVEDGAVERGSLKCRTVG